MLGEDQRGSQAKVPAADFAQIIVQDLGETAFAPTSGDFPTERPELTGRAVHVSLESALELQQRLLEENDEVDGPQVQGRPLEAVRERSCGKTTIVFPPPRKALLPSGGDDLAVSQECDRAFTTECRDPQDFHRRSEQRAKVRWAGPAHPV